MKNMFEQICTKCECDIISVDCGNKHPFFFMKTHIKMALLRGAVFEISYGQGMLEHPNTNRKVFLNNAMALAKLSKGKGIIVSSEASKKVFMRSPTDVVHIAQMFGLTQDQAQLTLTQNCVRAFAHAHSRKTHKGVAEVIEMKDSSDEGEEQGQESDQEMI